MRADASRNRLAYMLLAGATMGSIACGQPDLDDNLMEQDHEVSAASLGRTCASHPEGSVACITDFRKLEVWDKDCDGHWVRAEYQGVAGTLYYSAVDPNGCVTGGLTVNLTVNVLRYRVCTDREGCSDWRLNN